MVENQNLKKSIINLIDFKQFSTKEEYFNTAFENCKYMQEMALIPYDKKTKVGSVITGQDYNYKQKFFGGCNIKISESHVYHAEIIALLNCLSENYRPIHVFVTSRSIEENIHCCLDCRGRLLECNPQMIITVFNPDGTIKHQGMMKNDQQYIMENKTGKIDWDQLFKKQRFQKLGR
jgi:cytidine deaminase